MPCLKVALTAVDKAFGNQVTICRALQNQTRTETHHQYLNLLMLTVDSLPSADLKSLQTYLGPCPAAVSRNNFWPAVEVHTSLYQFWCPWHMNFIQITELFKKMNPKDFVSRNQWSMHLNHKVGEGMQRWWCGRKVRQTSNATTAREARTNGKGDVSWTRTWWVSFADLIDMYLCTHMPKSVGTYQEDLLKLGHRTCKNDPSLFAAWITAIRTVHIDGEIPCKKYAHCQSLQRTWYPPQPFVQPAHMSPKFPT